MQTSYEEFTSKQMGHSTAQHNSVRLRCKAAIVTYVEAYRNTCMKLTYVVIKQDADRKDSEEKVV